MPGKTVVVAAVIVDDLNRPTRMLAARRNRPQELAGRWEFPGGKVEPGESDHEGLRRELREELGVEVQLGEQVVGPEDGGWPITPKHTMHLWFATVASGTPAPLIEHDQLQWITVPEFMSLNWLDGDVVIVEHLRSYFLTSPRSATG